MKSLKKLLKNLLNSIDYNLILLIIVITLILSKIFLKGIIYGHDTFVHVFRISNMAHNLLDGNIFAKIGYDYINGFGYGTGIFYPQINLILSSLIYILSDDIILSLKLYVYINSLLSGIFMYYYLNYKLKNKNNALIGTLLYVLAPYFLVQIMIRCAIGESVIFLALPIIFWGIDRILEREKYGNLLLIIGGILILNSHLISTIYVIIFVIIYLICQYKKVLNKHVMIDFLKCCIIIALSSLYFIVPFLEHYVTKGYNMIISTGINPEKQVLSLNKLVFEGNYNLGFLLVGVVLIFPLIYKNIKSKKNPLIFYIMGIICILMMLCPYIWNRSAILDIIQFPWRLLSFAIFFFSIVGVYIYNYFNINKRFFSLCVFLIIVLSFIILGKYISQINMREAGFNLEKDIKFQIIDENNKNLHTSLGGNDYLPIECKIDYIAKRGKDLIALNGNIINNYNYKFEQGKIYSYIQVEKNTEVELPLIYYIGYNITIDGNKIDYVKDKNGFIKIKFDKYNEGFLKVKYTGTNLDVIANIVSLISFFGIFLYYIYQLITNKILKKKIHFCNK